MKKTFLICALVFLGLCGCSKEARKTRMLDTAQKDFAAEEYDRAEIGYLNALRLAPADPTAIRQLGTIYFAQGRLLEAYRFLQRTAEIEPENIDAQMRLGAAYLSFRKIKEARAQAEKVLAKRPGDEEALLLLAETAVSDKEIPQVAQQIEQLRKGDKPRAGYHLALGALHLRQNELAKAEREIKSAAAMEPNAGSVQIALGTLHLARKELNDAEKAFRAAAQSAPARSPHRLKYAEFLLTHGKIAESKTVLEEITGKAPDYLPAWSLLIQIAFHEKKLDECAALVSKVLSRDPANFDALRHSASLKMARGDFARAIEEFERINKVYQRIPEIQYQLGQAYFLNGDIPKALRNINLALSSNPDFAPAILLLAEIQLRQGDAISAIPRLTQLIKNRPQTGQAHLLLANAYRLQEKSDEALAVYRQMASLFPKDPQPLLLSGITLVRNGKRIEARKAFQKSLELDPDYLPALDQMVQLDIAEKAFAAATERVRNEIQKKPATAEFWVLMANIQLAQKDITGAEASLQKSLALNPELRVAYTLLAQLYADSNRQQEALEKLTEVSEKTNSVSVLMQIGMIHDQLKNFSAARDSYEKILTFKPNFSPALNNLAYLYSEHLNHLDNAYGMAQKARQLLPYDPSTADTLGWILYKQGNYPRALALLQESAAKLPDIAEVQFHLGMTYYMMGEEEAARVALGKAAQSRDQFPGKSEIALRLAILKIDPGTKSKAELELLEERLDDEPRDAIASAHLAAIHERQGNFKKAIRICENALEHNPSNARIMIQLAGLYAHHLNDRAKATELARQAHNLAPENPHISQVLGRLAYESGDYSWALSLAEEAARRLPEKTDLAYDLARGYYAVGHVDSAVTAMKKVANAGPSFENSGEAKQFLAMLDLYRTPSKIKTALPDVMEILKKDSDYIPALMVLAVALEQDGNFQEAKKQYEKILAANPLFAPAYRDLARLNSKHRIEDGRAYEVAAKAREAFPESPEIAKILGVLVYGRKDYSRAAQLLNESSRARESDPELFYYLGMANYQLKKADDCRAALKRALALNLSAQLAGEAQRVLAELR